MSTFQTSDVSVVAVLKMHGVQIVGKHRNARGRCVYEFPNSAALQSLIDSYYDGALTGSLAEYSSHVRTVLADLKGDVGR